MATQQNMEASLRAAEGNYLFDRAFDTVLKKGNLAKAQAAAHSLISSPEHHHLVLLPSVHAAKAQKKAARAKSSNVGNSSKARRTSLIKTTEMTGQKRKNKCHIWPPSLGLLSKDLFLVP